jgi:putative copper export protein
MFFIEASASAITYCTLALFLGCLMTAGLLLPCGEPSQLVQQLFSFARNLLPLFIIASIISLVIQGTKLNSGAVPTFEILSRYLFLTQSGKIWAVREIYALLLLGGMCWYGRSRYHLTGVRMFLLLSLPLVASRSLTSHAVAVREHTALAVSADALHLLSTAVWAGGLPVLFWILYRGTRRLHLAPSWSATNVHRFSWFALVAVVVLVTTGLYQSWIQVQRLDILFATPYGQILTLKVLIFLCMGAIGALNLFSTKPKLLDSARMEQLPNWLQRKTLRRIGSEAMLGLGIFCVTAILTLLPPGIHSLHQANASGNNQLQAYPDKLNLFTWLSYLIAPAPKLEPAEGAKITILSPQEGQVFKSDEVPMRYDFLKGKRGNHLHAYIDGKLMGMFSDPSGGTLTGIQPGKHVLELRVTTEDHVTELDAKDRVDFVVQ